jgi:hypothetical protein
MEREIRAALQAHQQNARRQAIIEAINNKTGLNMVFDEAVKDLVMKAKDDQGPCLIVAHGPFNGLLSIRSLLTRAGNYWWDDFTIPDPIPEG